MIKALGCSHAYIYAMGQEPWLTFVSSIIYTEKSVPIVESDRLVDTCRQQGIQAKRLFGKEEMTW